MFKKAPNYFYKPQPAPKYKPIQLVYEWETKKPPENLPTNVLPFLKEVKNYVQTKHNFQEDINNQIFFTPEEITKNNIQLEPKNLQYQKEDIKNFNATDLRNAAKEIKNEAVQKAAENETNKQILKLQKEINDLKNQNQNNNQNQKKENK